MAGWPTGVSTPRLIDAWTARTAACDQMASGLCIGDGAQSRIVDMPGQPGDARLLAFAKCAFRRILAMEAWSPNNPDRSLAALFKKNGDASDTAPPDSGPPIGASTLVATAVRRGLSHGSWRSRAGYAVGPCSAALAPARSLSDALRMPSGVPGIQINRTAGIVDIAGLALNSSLPGPSHRAAWTSRRGMVDPAETRASSRLENEHFVALCDGGAVSNNPDRPLAAWF